MVLVPSLPPTPCSTSLTLPSWASSASLTPGRLPSLTHLTGEGSLEVDEAPSFSTDFGEPETLPVTPCLQVMAEARRLPKELCTEKFVQQLW